MDKLLLLSLLIMLSVLLREKKHELKSFILSCSNELLLIYLYVLDFVNNGLMHKNVGT